MTSATHAHKHRVGELHPAPYNPRKISPEGMENLAESLREFGDLSGVVLNIRTQHLVGGHQRVKILEDEWPIKKELTTDKTGTVALGYISTPWGQFFYREVDWPIEKEMAANISANKSRAEFDKATLTPLLIQLEANKFDLKLTGFSQDFLKRSIDMKANQRNEPQQHHVPKKVVTRPGDIWKLGKHRILCGDSIDPQAVKRLTGGAEIDAIITDPPYCSGGFQECGKAHGSVGTKSAKYKCAGKIKNDTLSTRGYQSLLKGVFSNFAAVMAYVFTDWRMWVNLYDVMESKGFGIRNMRPWGMWSM